MLAVFPGPECNWRSSWSIHWLCGITLFEILEFTILMGFGMWGYNLANMGEYVQRPTMTNGDHEPGAMSPTLNSYGDNKETKTAWLHSSGIYIRAKANDHDPADDRGTKDSFKS